MKLVCNKAEAEILKHINLREENGEVFATLNEVIQAVEINYNNPNNQDKAEKLQQVRIAVKDGIPYIGIRNRYGNGFRTIPLSSLATLLWEDKTGLDNKHTLEENKTKYTVS